MSREDLTSTTTMAKTRHASLEMVDPDAVLKEKKKDMLSKARNKLSNLGDVLKPTKTVEDNSQKKSRTQATLDYFFKPCPSPHKHQVFANNNNNNQQTTTVNGAGTLRKQHSVGAYPITGVDLADVVLAEEQHASAAAISRLRPATICIDKLGNGDAIPVRDAAALVLERPRKKLSFREPEIVGYPTRQMSSLPRRKDGVVVDMKRNGQQGVSAVGMVNGGRGPGREDCVELEDQELESQAMRVVRTVGQAFEVCHKLSITAPENELGDCDEQDTLTQDLVSDRLSDITSDKPKKDLISEGGASDKLSLPDEDCYRDLNSLDNNNRNPNIKSFNLDLLPPLTNKSSRISPLMASDTYASPLGEGLLNAGGGSLGGGGSSNGCGGGSSSIPVAGSTTLSTHHELQLLREQLDQQTQQTQAALAQLQLTREQLAAEQSARMEAQARTHQLLVHNRELLDHIAALVAHLQGGEKSSSQQQSPHVTMPQQHLQSLLTDPSGYYPDHHTTTAMDPTATFDNSPTSAYLQALGLNPQGLIENRAVTSCLPPHSPLRTASSSGGGGGGGGPGNIFNFSYPPHQMQQPPPPPDLTAFETQLLQRLQALSGYTPPYNYPNPTNSGYHLYTQPPQLNNNYTTLQHPPKKNLTQSPLTGRHSFGANSPGALESRISPMRSTEPVQYQSQQNLNLLQYPGGGYPSQNHLQVGQGGQQQPPQRSPLPERKGGDTLPVGKYIKPLAQMGTITTTDSSGRLRVIVPVPTGNSSLGSSGSHDDEQSAVRLMSTLRLGDEVRSAPITRSTSEKVPNRSELMSQVQRTAWARHTTK